jgi:pimeloyl-ACP methyl ester carboxylesterase
VARIVIIPGLSVRSYAKPSAVALARTGHRVSLLAAPGWRRTKTDLGEFGRVLAGDLERRGETVDLLVGLSVGTQAAACAAVATTRIRQLLLISPTVDPVHRTLPRLLTRWLRGDSDGDEESPRLQTQVPDWARAGVPRIAAGLVSALRTPLEAILPRVDAEVTVVHAEHDVLSTEPWARSLAVDDGHFRWMPDAPHSWPVHDGARFSSLVAELVS